MSREGKAPGGMAPGDLPSLAQEQPIDLLAGRAAHWPARDQGSRDTCVAYAVAACLELQRARGGGPFIRLSPQFLYWQMRQLPEPPSPPPGWAAGATKLGQAREVLRHHGICLEQACPDADIFPPAGAPVAGPAPGAEAIAQAQRLRVSEGAYGDWPPPGPRPADLVRMLHHQLAQGRPVAVALPQFRAPGAGTTAPTNWWLPDVAHTGLLPEPPAGWTAVAGHAVCVTGFQPDRDASGGGWFIFRNSRGLDWARAALDPLRQGPPQLPARGFGALSAGHVARHGWELFCPILE